jgi:hypothetical protein
MTTDTQKKRNTRGDQPGDGDGVIATDGGTGPAGPGRPGSDGDGSSPLNRRTGAGVAVLVVGVVLLWVLRPLFHGVVYGLYSTPTLVPVLVVGAVAVGVLARRRGLETALQGGAIVVVLLFFALSVPAGYFADEKLGKQTLADSATVDGLADSDPENPRIVPRSVSQRFASNTLNFPQYRVGDSDVTVYNGTLHWAYPLSPDGTFNYLTKRQHGTVLVDMTEQSASVDTVTGDIDRGVGTAPYNNYRWKLLRNGQYLVNYHDPFMVVADGEQHVVVPYTKPNFHWWPLPHTTPEWGGVAVVHGNGTVTDLSPAAARDHPALTGQRLYPFELTERSVAATKYRNGIINTFTSHEGEIEVAPVPGEDNDQPFTVMTEDGIAYVVAVEPFGDAQGLREVWTVDARTGEYERLSVEESLLGPRKATDFVRQAARTTDWDRFDPSEPIPVVVDGTFYWEVRVVPTDSSGISYIAFVDAESSDVAEVEETAGVAAFIRGESPRTTDGADDTESDREPTVIVERVAPNGTVTGKLEVYDNESVRIVQENATGN